MSDFSGLRVFEGLALGAHVGLAAAWRVRSTAARAEGAETLGSVSPWNWDVERVKRSQIPTVKASKPYKETPADERLFEQVFGDEFRVASWFRFDFKYNDTKESRWKWRNMAFVPRTCIGPIVKHEQWTVSCRAFCWSRSGCYVSFSLSMSPFLQVYLQYTSEYMKGPMYWHPDKMSLGCGSFGCRIQFIEEGCLIWYRFGFWWLDCCSCSGRDAGNRLVAGRDLHQTILDVPLWRTVCIPARWSETWRPEDKTIGYRTSSG